jgi:O-antigen/teichoic acid export membrane protein
VATVASGAAVSQAIVMAFSPLITRLYGPEIYGLQGVFMSIAGVMGSVAAMNYPVAIVLPESDADAVGLARLSIYVGLVISLMVTALLYIFGTEILHLLNAAEIVDFIYLIPVFMFFSVLSMVSGQWLIRKKMFSLTAKVTSGQALVINAIKAGLGFIHPTAAALIVTTTSGVFLSAVMMFFGMRKKQSCDVEKSNGSSPALSPWQLAKRHRDFPLLRTPQVLLNSVSHSLPIIVLAAHFGPASAGFYTIASAVLGMPMVLIGSSVMQVFYPRINEAIHRGEDAKSLIIRATVGLALSGAVPFLIVILAGPTLFGFVFGNEWTVAGTYAQWLSIWIFFQYINKPAVAAIPALRIQQGLLIYELFSTGTKVLALYLGYIYFKSDVIAIALFSLLGAIAYMWLILWVIFHSGKLTTIK